MAKKAYVGVNGVARNISKMYVGVNGVARKIKKGYVGVNGVAQQFYDTYTELSYIEATGTQWLDTLVHFNYNLCAEVKFSFTTTSAPTDMHLLSTASIVSGTTYRFYPIAKGQSQNYFRCARYDNTVVFNNVTADTSVHTIIYGQRTSSTATPRVLWDNTNKGTLYSYNITSETTVPIFCSKTAAGNIGSYSLARLYYMKLYNNVTNELYRDFVPAKDSNNVVGLYDKVSNTFFYNQGTGDFVAGNEI